MAYMHQYTIFGSFVWDFTGHLWIPRTKASGAEIVSIWWHHHACTLVCLCHIYRQVSNIRRTLVDNKIVDHSDVVGASPVGAAATTFDTWLHWIGQRQLLDETRNI